VLLLAWAVVLCASAPLPFLETDALFFGAIAKSILRSGDWLTLHYEPLPGWVVDKPPLTFWMTAVSLALDGGGRIGLRLWHLVATIGLAATTYAIARLDGGADVAMLAALIVGTMLQVFYQSLTPQQDVPLALFLGLAWYALIRCERDGRAVWSIAAGGCVALATLTKGLAAPVMFGVVATWYLALRMRGSRPSGWSWIPVMLGVASYVILAAPWFIIGTLRQGPAFLETFFFGRVGVDRFFHPQLRPPIPYWQALFAYAPVVLAGTFPWTGALPGAWAAGRAAWRKEDAGRALCTVWFIAIFVLLSASPGDKVYRYLLPALPPLAVLAAHGVRDALRTGRSVRLLAGTAVATVGALWVGLIAIRAAAPADVAALYGPLALPYLAIMTTGALAGMGLALLGHGHAAVAALSVGALVAYGALEWSLSRRWDVAWPWPRMAATVARVRARGEPVFTVGGGGAFSGETSAAAFYLDPPIVAIDGAALAQAWTRRGVVALVSPQDWTRLPGKPRPIILLETPLGWRLVTNEGIPSPR
jgi:4-amino-4-deoxy-L-arabinose transferase-like glycosyltransferase